MDGYSLRTLGSDKEQFERDNYSKIASICSSKELEQQTNNSKLEDRRTTTMGRKKMTDMFIAESISISPRRKG
jgi:hypothetical protein